MADFLLELLSEEIPARMQAKARNDLARLFAEHTQGVGLSTGAIDTFSTPRRLVLIARDVAGATEASREELKGPRTSAPEQALEGFLRKTGLSTNQLEDRDGVYFAVVERAGRPAAQILADAVKRIVQDFPWPKSMRWGDGAQRWVRPLHGIVAILGDDAVPVDIDGLSAGATTVGHRFHHPGPITIGGTADYIEKLRACHVIVDHEEREKLIRDGAESTAAEIGLTLIQDEALVVENAGLTEWPVPLMGRFDPEFLDVPREVIVLTMRTNQKYFACTNDEGLLAPVFVCIANVAAKDGGEAIAEGNARVLAARLADARFFWEQDVKIPLEEQAKKLDGIVFHEKLGTVADKVERIAKLACWLVEQGVITASGRHPRESGNPAVPEGSGTPASAGATKEELAMLVERAARLAKADLVTGMVGEFPELQGVIGGYLAEAQGEPKAVADAVRDHYRPVGQGDGVPTAPVTVAVALADKLDTVLGFFANRFYPTGSKDPFALRRSMLGTMSLVLANQIRIDLDEFFQNNIGAFFEPIADPSRPPVDVIDIAALSRDPNVRVERESGRTTVSRGDDILMMLRGEFESLQDWDERTNSVWDGYERLLDFVTERMRVSLSDSGYGHDHVNAAMAASHQFRPAGLANYEYDLVRLLARVNALQSFVETGDGADLLTAYKRAANILKKEKWEGTGASGGFDWEPLEQVLIEALDSSEQKASAAIDKEDFTAAMAALATLRKPIDDFFDHVTVNDPDAAKRERRLNLLMRFRDAVNRVADFSKIEG